MGDKVASPAAAASPTANTPAVQAVPAKKTAASPKSKKPRVKPAHPRTSEMVNAAIASLKERGGSSLQAIKKYVASTYKIDAERQAPFIKKYLKTAVTNGLLIQTKGKGASGSFKIANGKNVSSTQPQPKVQRAAAKPAAPKKTVAVTKSPKKPIVATKKVAVVKKPASAAEKRKPVKTPAAKSPKVKAPSKAKKAAKTPTRKPKAPKPKKAAVAPKAAKPAPKKTASPRKK